MGGSFLKIKSPLQPPPIDFPRWRRFPIGGGLNSLRTRLLVCLFTCLLVNLFTCGYANAGRLGSWNVYYAYRNITEIEPSGDYVYVLSSGGLFSYHVNDESVQSYDKSNVLSDCGIAHIAYCPSAKRLLIVYDNGNMDVLLSNGDTENLSDYYNKSMTEDKSVNTIYIYQKFAYLSTGFGIMKVNVEDVEISDTYNLGFKVDYCYIENGRIYAASGSAGLWSGDLSDNLLDRNNWTRVGDYEPKSVDKRTVYDATNKCWWTSDENGKLMGYTENGGTRKIIVQGICPDGPEYNYFGFMRFTNNTLYSVGGGYSAHGELWRPAAIQSLSDGVWMLFEEDIAPRIGHHYADMLSIDVDPTDRSHVAVSGKSGVYEFVDGKFSKHYNIDNSPLLPAISGNMNYVIVPTLKYDNGGNLWCFNSRVKNASLFKLGKDGVWSSYHRNVFLSKNGRSMNGMSDMFFDSRGLLWMVNDHWDFPSFYAYNGSNDDVLAFTSFINQDGTTLSPVYVQDVTEDRSGNIWVATDVGVIVVYARDVVNGNTDAINQIKVPRNDGTNYADYLLDGVNVSCIAVDGGGRKWFGTNGNGVYLISEDNNTQIHHFLSTNSGLLSNTIESMAINDRTGEVFFGTDKGLCSYMSDANMPSDEMTKESVYAYPNPVSPDYTGLITVTGLSYDADVKILTSNGVLVAEGRSNGGMFTWDGKDLRGKRVASGVYMVHAATSEGKSGTVCKIAIVR